VQYARYVQYIIVQYSAVHRGPEMLLIVADVFSYATLSWWLCEGTEKGCNVTLTYRDAAR
jgi:hypothetical protein